MGYRLVIHEAMCGNTKAIARAIGGGLSGGRSVDVLEVAAAPAALAADVTLVVVGGPTHAFGMGRPSTRADAAKQADRPVISADVGVREWLERLSLAGTRPVIAAFDAELWGREIARRLELTPAVPPVA